jgi:hypothetical protein
MQFSRSHSPALPSIQADEDWLQVIFEATALTVASCNAGTGTVAFFITKQCDELQESFASHK